MTKKTKMVVGAVAVLGVAYYLWKRSQGMANMSGYANASGFASTGRRRVCTRMEKDGSTTTYTSIGGGCPYGGTVSN